MHTDSINSLIVKVSHGDNEAFEKLYRTMKKPVYYFALRFCASHEIAEDVMQDTFITIWDKSGSFIPNGNGRSWILSIAKNKTLNIINKNNRACSLDEADLVYEENFTKSFEESSVLGDLLRTLSDRESDIIILRHIVGLTLTEISKEKNMKKGTVFWAYNNAVKKLRKTYERMQLDEK